MSLVAISILIVGLKYPEIGNTTAQSSQLGSLLDQHGPREPYAYTRHGQLFIATFLK